jgi:hypothetical protein
VRVVSESASPEAPPGEAQTSQALTHGNQQRFKAQVEQQRRKRIALANSTLHRYRTNRETIVQNESRSVRKGSSESELKRRRETEPIQDGEEVVVRDAIISLFLIEENQSTGDGMRGCVSQDAPKNLGYVRSLAFTYEAGLVGSDQVRTYRRKTGRKHP